MRIQYRYVDYGTTFRSTAGMRKLDDTKAPGLLHENELALDVGGCCWGYEGCEDAVIDHHFERPGQFPSASAGVLHLAKRIRERFRGPGRMFENMWLVSHREPDFDSFCSMYLARHVILAGADPPDWQARGIHPLGWRDIEKGEMGASAKIPRISWFSPDPQRLGDEERWQILLAAVASCTDNAISTYCPPHLTLNSMLYAAGRRGRPYGGIDNGALEFFDRARDAILQHQLNPLVDSIFTGHEAFAPELDLLTRDVAAYERDLKRARMAPVSVPKTAEGEFQAFYDRVAGLPLLDAGDQLLLEHLAADAGYRQMDGIYIRDPESLLFRHWARRDTTHSSLGRGFTFTAIAYSGEMRDAPRNQTNYYFSLDPERAGDCHLYNVWALLEAAEINEILKLENSDFRALLEKLEHEAEVQYEEVEKQASAGDSEAAKQLESMRRTRCRTHFEKRAAKYKAFLDDPWFDGVNYHCSIVPTPNRGSLIGPSGSISDLTDDPVARIVRRALEYGIYGGPETTIDYPASSKSSDILHRPSSYLSAGTEIPALLVDHFRFGSVRLKGIEDLLQGNLAEQIGRNLWPLLNPGGDAVPSVFVEHHLIKSTYLIGIWNRRGIFVAYRPEERQIEQLREQFARMVELTRKLDEALERAHHPPPAHDRDAARKSVNEAEQLLLSIADFEHDLARTGSLLLHRMFAAIGVSQSLATVRDLHSATVERDQRQSTTTELVSLRITQEKIEWIEVLIVTLYATEMVHIVTDLLKTGDMWPARVVVLVAGAFGGLAYWGLVGSRSKVPLTERSPHWALRAIPICVGVLLAGLFVATYLWKQPEVTPNKSPVETQSSAPASPARQPKQPVEEPSK